MNELSVNCAPERGYKNFGGTQMKRKSNKCLISIDAFVSPLEQAHDKIVLDDVLKHLNLDYVITITMK